MRLERFIGLVLLLCACFLTGCDQEEVQTKEEVPAFTLLTGEETGLDFTNNLTSTKDFNVFHYMYFYNGGGVAVADFNQDSLMDVYFTANQTDNKLYLNTGDLKFRDVTAQAGVQGIPGWTTGVCAVDVNQDGLMDLYVSQLGDYRTVKGKNQLYICKGIEDGIPVFEDEATQYGLDLVGFGTQACFFDYDRDGDLDMFQLNHSVHNNGTFGQRKSFIGTTHPLSGDRMFRNDAGKFVEVTETCGIQSSVIGYGLGVSCGDIDLDGWPDLYICNDFHENDYLYLNQRDGTFREVLTEEMLHTSRFSMGVDIADINNDGYSEIFTLDMHPYDAHILKSSLGEDGYGTFQFKLGYGYNYQYARNALQLNNKNATFSEISVLAGVYATDWSWAALFCDFDQDGYKDLFVSNGIPKRMNDIDYVNFMSSDEVQWRIKTDNMEEADLALEQKLPEIRIPNKFFHNTGDLGFEQLQVSNELSGFSNGAAYADFDNDGDLDVIVNNIGDHPYLYRNMLHEQNTTHVAYLDVTLTGPKGNLQAIGAKAVAYRGRERIVDENFPVTGYQSSVAYGIYLGLGDLSTIDSIHLIWPDGTYQEIAPGETGQHIHLTWHAGLPVYPLRQAVSGDTVRAAVTDLTQSTGIDFAHEENDFVEFDREQLIPHMTSTDGPCLAVGDVNGDGLEDVFIGGAKWQRSALFLQTDHETFMQSRQSAMALDSLFEDVDARFVDVDGDKDLDLIVASGGNEFRNEAEPLRQRLYFNDGTGQFARDTSAFSGIYMTASCIADADFDGDGDIDVFIGGRAVPWSYGMMPRSYVLINDGKGHFSDATQDVCSELALCGLVRDAIWADMDADGKPELIVATEWGPIQLYRNRGGKLHREDIEGSNGLWNCLDVADMDSDGDLDIVAGNLGLNSELQATHDQPLRLYIGDFDENSQVDQLLTYYLNGKEVVFATYAEITKQLPNVKKKYLFAHDFADASAADLLGQDVLDKAECLKVYETRNGWFEHGKNGAFTFHALPRRMQFAPIRATLIRDFDGDGFVDLMAMGNFYEANIEMGRYDADYGTILFGGKKGFGNGTVQQLKVQGQIRNLQSVRTGDHDVIVVGRNNGPITVIGINQSSPDL